MEATPPPLSAPPSELPVVYYATRSGGATLDTGGSGGNPFAAALIEVADEGVGLRDLSNRLREVTAAISRGLQQPECVGSPRRPAWRWERGSESSRESRMALVLVVSDYSASAWGPDASLPGAARDERRIAAMFAKHGFSVEQGVGTSRSELLHALGTFRRRSRDADVAALYCTGHGVELDGIVYLLPGDFPPPERLVAPRVRRYAIGVPRMTRATAATEQNLLFFAGCRTHLLDGAGKRAAEAADALVPRRPREHSVGILTSATPETPSEHS